MNGITAIAIHESRRLFVSPLAWGIAAASQLLAGLLFVMSLTDLMLNPDRLSAYDGVSSVAAAGLFRFVTLLLLLVVPLLTMRSFAEERKHATLELLAAAPVSLTELVLGKYAGLMIYLSLIWALVLAMPIVLMGFTPLDTGVVATGAIGLWLVMAAFTAFGLLASTLTREPALAAIITLAGLLLAWLAYALSSVDWQPTLYGHSIDIAGAIRGLSPIGHHDALLRGLFSTADVLYFVIVIAACLALAITRLDAERG